MTPASAEALADRDAADLWDLVLETVPDPEMALILLSKAVAHGCNCGDYCPGTLIDLIRADFDRIHIAKHMGRRQ